MAVDYSPRMKVLNTKDTLKCVQTPEITKRPNNSLGEFAVIQYIDGSISNCSLFKIRHHLVLFGKILCMSGSMSLTD